jgi:hypothetical protein
MSMKSEEMNYFIDYNSLYDTFLLVQHLSLSLAARGVTPTTSFK